MGLRFEMQSETLGILTKKTTTSSDDLGTLIHQLAQSAEPLEGKFNGDARSIFDQFKANTDNITVELNNSLNAVLEGIAGQDLSFKEGEIEMVDVVSAADKGAGWDAARFR